MQIRHLTRATRKYSQHALLGLAFLAGVSPAMALPMVAIYDANDLVFFDSAAPGTIVDVLPVSGLQPGESLLGIDRRPLTGGLYGLGSSGRLYAIDMFSGAAAQVGDVLAVALTGTSFGFDFNPAADRIRVISNAELNFRLNPITGAVVDTDGGTAGTQTDPGLTPAGNAVAAAYDRNDNDGGTPTTLYVIDSALDQLQLQGGFNGVPSPNGGMLTNVGSLAVDTTEAVGFDIADSSNGFAVLNVAGVSTLHSINLSTGTATAIGAVGVNGVSGLAVLTAFPVAEIFRDGFEAL
jgi:hypothetical protein